MTKDHHHRRSGRSHARPDDASAADGPAMDGAADPDRPESAESILGLRLDRFMHKQPVLAALMAFSIGVFALSLIGKDKMATAGPRHAR